VVGTTIDHYRIAERLGAGGMGEVYRAEDIRLGRSVALKFPQSKLQHDPEQRSRLMREARAAAALRSPHIAAIYDIGEHEGSIYIAMEFVDGQLLSSRIEREPLEVREAVNIAMQVAEALEEAHSRGIVHRDIKSANIIVSDRGRVKVLDFGLAKFMTAAEPSGLSATVSQQTTAGTVLGTFSYMSPEQALGRAVDHRSDIFSLGVVIFEMTTARLPFQGSTATEILDRIMHHEPAALARFNYEVPADLERIVRKALQKNADFRYQTARDFYIDLRDLSRVLDSAGRVDAPASDGVAGASAGVAAEPGSQAVAVMTFSNITKEPADDWIGTGIAETITADLKNVHGLSVMGRAQIFDALKTMSSTASLDERAAIEIGRHLGAAWIVGGGYQRLGEMIRITAQIIEVRTSSVIKTLKIDGRIADLFDLQDRIVLELSQGLNLELAATDIANIERDETKSIEAYEDYSRGLMNLRIASRDSIDRAIASFERAIDRDPKYAAAWAALGEASQLKGGFLSLPDLLERGVAALRRAIELDPKLANAYSWLGAALVNIGRYDEAIETISKGIELEPGNAGAHAALARAYWIGKGRIDEGIRELEQTIAINPQAGYSYLQLGLLYALRGDFAKAEEICMTAVQLQEQYMSGTEGLLVVGAHARLGYIYYLQGRYDEAIRHYERELMFLSSSDHALRDRTSIEVNQKMGAAYLRKGKTDEANQYFDRALKSYQKRVSGGADDPFTKYYIASLFALRGDVDSALRHLTESSAQLRELNRTRLRVDPDFDAVRQDPRFAALVAGA
jgi:tetratricopeptide (TPR) repeat protein/tRNA A-37 threonylcarbamoyl transferase component Bud32